MANRGASGDSGMCETMTWMAVRGQMGEEPKEGICTVAYWDCF